MIFHCSTIGYSHLSAGKICQDASKSWTTPDGTVAILAVADGHGGEEYPQSHIGAMIACQTALNTLKEFATICKDYPGEDKIRQIIRAILSKWHSSLPCADTKHFGTTLITYLQTPNYWIALQIGDGKMVKIDEKGEFSQPIPWDDRCILNFTTSMCDDDAANNFRYAHGKKTPKAAILATDGIDTTFLDGELLYNFYQNLIETAQNSTPEEIMRALPRCLAHFSKIGSTDDMSIAAIIN